MWSASSAWFFSRYMAVRSVQILAAGHLLTETVGAPIPCAGVSMMPTIAPWGEVLFISRIPYWNRRPARGELVAYRKPTEPQVTVLKRVIAIEGDVVEVDPRRGEGISWSGGRVLFGPTGEGDQAGEDAPQSVERWGEGKFIRVPKGHVWCVGDNLSNSTDSRDYGPVPVATIKGMAVARVCKNNWPAFERLTTTVRELGPSS